jgi:hypothetical protein
LKRLDAGGGDGGALGPGRGPKRSPPIFSSASKPTMKFNPAFSNWHPRTTAVTPAAGIVTR